MAFIASKPLMNTGIATLALLCSALPALAGNAYSVSLNKTEIVRLPAQAGAVIIGNPAIADVTVHSPDTLFVIGKGYGETNLIVFDAQGETIMNADIQVINKLPQQSVRLYNGKERESYNCAPYCMPSPILGDAPDFIGRNSGTADTSTSAPVIAPSSSPETSFGSTTSFQGASEQSSFEDF